MTATVLRNILIVLILTVAIGGAVGLSYGYRVIKNHAVDVSHKKVDATASNGNLAALKKTEQYLNANKDVLEKISLLKATNEFPEFRIVNEIRSIAAKNNISVSSFSYGTATGTTAAAPTTAAPATPAPTASTSAAKTIALSVTFTAPSYLEFLQFTYDIEQNLPKMKIQGIGISNGSTGGTQTSGAAATSTGISIDPITVEMYIN